MWQNRLNKLKLAAVIAATCFFLMLSTVIFAALGTMLLTHWGFLT